MAINWTPQLKWEDASDITQMLASHRAMLQHAIDRCQFEDIRKSYEQELDLTNTCYDKLKQAMRK